MQIRTQPNKKSGIAKGIRRRQSLLDGLDLGGWELEKGDLALP